jgi:hypothetical protein
MAIQQHPIPQDVAGYRFRLIGEMTIKQFAWLAAGIIGGLVFYSSPLPFFFKYPFAVICVLIGAGTAFVPIQGRPMDKWIIAFIRSIYSPTQYVWKKTPTALDQTPITTMSPQPIKVNIPQPSAPTPSSIPPTPAPTPIPVPTPITPPIPVQTPPTPEVVSVPKPQPQVEPISVSPVPPTPAPAPQPVAPVQPTIPAPQPQVTVATPQAPLDSNLPVPITPTSPNTLVGMTLTPQGKILDGALIEIQSQGTTIRATKSNQLGPFLFAKPLDNGIYQISTEKDGFDFDSYSLNLTGQIVKPLKLQAKTG